MDLQYFVVDENQQLWRCSRQTVENVWAGRGTIDQLECDVGEELRLISVLCDGELNPKICFFLRINIIQGKLDDDSRIEAYEAMTCTRHRQYDHPAVQYQFSNWPYDWQHQLAVALDVPAMELRKIGIGGPLLMSDLWGLPLEKILEYFELAIDD